MAAVCERSAALRSPTTRASPRDPTGCSGAPSSRRCWRMPSPAPPCRSGWPAWKRARSCVRPSTTTPIFRRPRHPRNGMLVSRTTSRGRFTTLDTPIRLFAHAGYDPDTLPMLGEHTETVCARRPGRQEIARCERRRSVVSGLTLGVGQADTGHCALPNYAEFLGAERGTALAAWPGGMPKRVPRRRRSAVPS